MAVNKAIIVGNLGQDPEIRYTQSGGAVANFSVATTEKWRDKQSGEMKEETQWHRIVVWGKPAEFVAEYAKKGSSVYVEGKIVTRKWQNNNGDDVYTTEIVARDVQLVGGRRDDGAAPQGQQPRQQQPQQQQQQQQRQQPQQRQQQQQGQQQYEPPIDFDDDIPF